MRCPRQVNAPPATHPQSVTHPAPPSVSDAFVMLDELLCSRAFNAHTLSSSLLPLKALRKALLKALIFFYSKGQARGGQEAERAVPVQGSGRPKAASRLAQIEPELSLDIALIEH
jgi:hypothetical protein